MRAWLLDHDIEALHQHASLGAQPLALEAAPERLGFIDGRLGPQAVEGRLLGGAVGGRLPLRHCRLRRGRRSCGRLRRRGGYSEAQALHQPRKLRSQLLATQFARETRGLLVGGIGAQTNQAILIALAQRLGRERRRDFRPRRHQRRGFRLGCLLGCLSFLPGEELVDLRSSQARIGAIRMNGEESAPAIEGGKSFRGPIVRSLVGVGICRRRRGRARRRRGNGGHARRRRDRRRHQRDTVPAQRAIDIRLLTMVGRAQHVIAHLAEREPDIEARLGDVFEERGRERAIASVAVIGDGARLGREGDQRVSDSRADPGEAHRDAPGHVRVVRRGMKRILPACVQNDQAQLFDMARCDENPVQRHRLVLHVEHACQFGVDRDEVVYAPDFQSMSGIIDDRDIGAGRPVDKFPNRPLELHDAQIPAAIDGIESGFGEQVRDRVGVVGRIGKNARVLITAVANDQSDPPISERRALRREGDPKRKRETERQPGKDAHRPTSPFPTEPLVGTSEKDILMMSCRRQFTSLATRKPLA